jgi:SAM-dependent methyltransferase
MTVARFRVAQDGELIPMGCGCAPMALPASQPGCLCAPTLETLQGAPDGQAAEVCGALCLYGHREPGRYLQECWRVLRAGGRLRLTLTVDQRGGNVSPAWLLHWVEQSRHWTLQRRQDGEIVVWLQKDA